MLFISAVGGGAYLMACGSDGSEFDNTKKDGGLGGDGSDNGGGIGDGGIGGDGGGGGDGGECEHVIQAVIRDFKPCNAQITGGEQADLDGCKDNPAGHPDFEHYQGDEATTGIVAADLSLPDRKPAYVGDGPHHYPNQPNKFETTSKVAFESWYHDVDGNGLNANKRITVPLELKETVTDAGAKHYVFDDRTFFPIDGKGWGNGPKPQNGSADHNFAFTTEAHFSFVYKGGEEFTFRGDDDLWLFINDKLAIDLGGLHPELLATVNLDDEAARLGLVKGQRYPMDLFHAERHTTASRFRIDTTIECVSNSPVH
ncbi:fibro-slime domain-containing protein [Pendulispora rubella]|uniref:Fibro-slime domain-containing protein n=1 Tax=Pendulispora rubella TaxID=2741070 RepID=A0ABZ2KWA6_9BACT